jgi:hypothetical protein
MRTMLTLLLTALVQDPTVLRFEGPIKAKPEDLKKAATALEGRCRAYGYEGITASLVKTKSGHAIELTSKIGFTATMQDTITRKLISGRSLNPELVFMRKLSQAEFEQYPEPKGPAEDLTKAKCPSGTKWVWLRIVGTSTSFPALLLDGHRLSAGDFECSYEGGPERPSGYLRIKLTDAGRERWKAFPAEVKAARPVLIFDGAEVLDGAWFDPLRETKGEIVGSRYSQQDEAARLCHPLPFELRQTK